jgi:ferredoxin-NADP reductase
MANGNLVASPIPARDEAPYRVIAIEDRTPVIVEVWLRPMVEPMEYRPGEYVLLEDARRQIPPRSYSIANAPRPDGTFVADSASAAPCLYLAAGSGLAPIRTLTKQRSKRFHSDRSR